MLFILGLVQAVGRWDRAASAACPLHTWILDLLVVLVSLQSSVVKSALGGINVRDADCQKCKYYLGLASFCRFEVYSFHPNAFIERVYCTVAAIVKDWVQ